MLLPSQCVPVGNKEHFLFCLLLMNNTRHRENPFKSLFRLFPVSGKQENYH